MRIEHLVMDLGRLRSVAFRATLICVKRFWMATFVSLLFLFVPTQSAQAWDPQPTNPFPGVPFEGEIPGYTVEVPCGSGSDGADCGIGIVPVVACPPWSAGDGRNGYVNDGPPGDPHKKVGIARRFCRNSWTPPTTAADEADFRNRIDLATAAATLESQNWNAAHPGLQKCMQWGPIVHANGISTASGGVCANPVAAPAGSSPTSSETSTVKPAPSETRTAEGGGASPPAAPQASIPSSPAPSTPSPSAPSESQTAGAPSIPASPVIQVPAVRTIDLTQYGIGKPFTRVVKGNIGPSDCPSSFQAASNTINTGVEYGATECWPANAWAAYSIGGDVWAQFKASNGSIDAQAEAARRIQVNAIRALALQQAQTLANATPGIKRCNSWSGFGEVGQECAYIPVQNNSAGPMSTISTGETTTSVLRKTTEVVVSKIASSPGQSQSDWEETVEYKAFTCPAGAGRAISIDLAGTIARNDDVWILSCVRVDVDTMTVSVETKTVQSPLPSDTLTVASNPAPQIPLLMDTKGATTLEIVTASTLVSDPIDFKGTTQKIVEVSKTMGLSNTESSAVTFVTNKINAIQATSKMVKVALPNSPVLIETARSLTPTVCKISGLNVQPVKTGSCLITYTFEGVSGNSFETTKKIVFKK